MYHPQGDGLVERTNRTVLSMLATIVKDHYDLLEIIFKSYTYGL